MVQKLDSSKPLRSQLHWAVSFLEGSVVLSLSFFMALCGLASYMVQGLWEYLKSMIGPKEVK